MELSYQEKIQQLKEYFKNRDDIVMAFVFGSQATGKTHLKSDTDIGFLSEKRLSPRATAEIAFTLENNYGIIRPELIDVRDAPPLLLRNIAQNSILLYEREPQIFARFKIYALKRFMEAKSLLAAREASLAAFLQNA